MMTANATGPGAYILTCDDNAPLGKWVATINAVLPVANAQVANKEYVDTAVAAAGGGSCQAPVADTTGYTEGGNLFYCRSTLVASGGVSVSSSINNGRACGNNQRCVSGTCVSGDGAGQVMPDGTVLLGSFGGYTLYTTPADQGASVQWKTSAGVNDIATDSNTDGLANSNQVPNSTTFPAFKLCKDLSFGGYSDWYLPAVDELSFLYTQLKAGTTSNPFGLVAIGYFSSTEVSTFYVHHVSLTDGTVYNNTSKSATARIRCVRRQ